MSLINQVLHDLDRRHRGGAVDQVLRDLAGDRALFFRLLAAAAAQSSPARAKPCWA